MVKKSHEKPAKKVEKSEPTRQLEKRELTKQKGVGSPKSPRLNTPQRCLDTCVSLPIVPPPLPWESAFIAKEWG